MSKSFISYPLTHGLLADLSADEFPTQLWGWNQGILNLPDIGTHFGFVYQGEPVLMTPTSGVFVLKPGMYFSLPGSARLLGAGSGIAITRLGYEGVFSIGGPLEKTGKLLYIDGAMDSLLIPPPMLGDPCLNGLYFPAGISQTQHTHPSMRVGMVVSGRGECVTPDEVIPLTPGVVFVIPALSLHSFRTTDSPMVVCAYHPDSNCGPTHEAHPMILKTMINGVSATHLKEIRTCG